MSFAAGTRATATFLLSGGVSGRVDQEVPCHADIRLTLDRFMPPLMVTFEEVDEALAALDASLNERKQGAAS